MKGMRPYTESSSVNTLTDIEHEQYDTYHLGSFHTVINTHWPTWSQGTSTNLLEPLGFVLSIIMLIISSNMATQRWYYIKTSFLYSQKVTASLVSRVELSYATKSKRFPKNMENIFFITAAQPNLCTHTHTHTHKLYYTTSALLHKTFSNNIHKVGCLEYL